MFDRPFHIEQLREFAIEAEMLDMADLTQVEKLIAKIEKQS